MVIVMLITMSNSNLTVEQLFNMIVIYMTHYNIHLQHTSHKILILFSQCKDKAK